VRIVLLIRSLGDGGTERQVTSLAIGLHRRGHRVVVVQLFAGMHFLADLGGAGVPVWTAGMRGRWDLGRLAGTLRKVRRFRPDVVHGFHVESNLLALALSAGAPARAVWAVRHADDGRRPDDSLARALRHIHDGLAPRADLLIANSRLARRQLLDRGLAPKRVVAIDNGIDGDRFAPDAEARRALRAHWGVGESELLIGAVARLDPIKDHVTFLQAAALARRSERPIRFVCVGGGPAAYASQLVALAERLQVADRVRWLGVRHDMPRVYNALDVCTVPSLREGLSNAACEAIACGVPCVVTDVGDHRRLSGVAVVVPPGDAGALADGWRRALEMAPAERAAARRWIRESFGVDRFLDETELTLARLVEASSGSRTAPAAAN
jgi:glycosyltransferase involved in cell wall biosynthesis